MTPEERAEREQARKRAFYEKKKARMAEDPEFAEQERAKHRAATREFRAKHRERINAAARERMRAERATPEGRLKTIFYTRAHRARKKGLPVGDFGEWLAALPPRPADTDLWEWDLVAIDPEKGVTAGNFRWQKSLRDKVLTEKAETLNIGICGSTRYKRRRLARIARRDGLDTLDEVEHSPAALAREIRAPIDHEANVGAFFGYSLRVIAVEYRHVPSRTDPKVFYVCRCSACGGVFSRLALRLVGTRSRPRNDTCPHCQETAKRSVSQAKNSRYAELKKELKKLTVHDAVLKNSHSDYGIRNRDMDFCEHCIDADLLGYGETLREIYAI